MYFVWRRNDGYVAATCGRMPRNWTINAGTERANIISFEKLGEFESWFDAYEAVQNARGNPQADPEAAV